MKLDLDVVKNDERAIFELRSLYEGYGYSRYKMSKFEEYDLYVRNKDFLVSDNIITFTDTNGKLMALKPDVTLSIIKNSKDNINSVSKVYYNENVYRVSKGTHSFKEIMQVGLECIGNIDEYCIYEVLMLAAKSLCSISEDFVLDISHMGIVSSVIDSMQLGEGAREAVLKCIGEKNIHGIQKICEEEGVDGSNLKRLVTAYGSPDKVIPIIKEITPQEDKSIIDELINITTVLDKNGFGDKIKIDFSVINDMSYYNGFVFKGFVKDIATGILSGGQYDKLMKKMGRKSGAVGFAVYLDMIERLNGPDKSYDVDTVILYDDDAGLCEINEAVKLFCANGKSVMVQREKPSRIKYRQLVKLKERGVEIIENNA